MEAMKAAGADGAADGGVADAAREQLRAADHAVLLGRQRANCLEFLSVSERNPGQFGHSARIGPRAAPAQPPVCDDSA
jgi:hypothetical protein